MQRFIIVALLALVALTNASTENVTFGRRHALDGLMDQKEVRRSWLPLTKVEEEVTLAGDGKKIINFVEIIDLENTSAEKTSKVHVTSGGTGYTYISLKFVSARGNGIHKLIKIYGHPAN